MLAAVAAASRFTTNRPPMIIANPPMMKVISQVNPATLALKLELSLVASVIGRIVLLERTARAPHPRGPEEERGGDDQSDPKPGAAQEFHWIELREPIDYRNMRTMRVANDNEGAVSAAPQPAA